jgi:hypothetical protein
MPVTLRRLTRAVISLFVLVGLGLSMLESPACSANEEGARASAVGTDAAYPASDASAPAPEHPCCPCLHTFPQTTIVAFVTTSTLVGFPTDPDTPTATPRDRNPQPLVPPPIA